jgi:hypothetical protein
MNTQEWDGETLVDITVTCANSGCENFAYEMVLRVPDVGQGQAVCGVCGTQLWSRES